MNQENGNVRGGFTLAELVLAMSVLVLLIILVAQIVGHTSNITASGVQRIDANSQARQVFGRLAIDFAQAVVRTDVSFFAKNASLPMESTGERNDLIAFFASLRGYYPTTPSSVSVVGYRINGDPENIRVHNRLERMCKGLPWNGASAAAMVFLPHTIHARWPEVSSVTAYDNPSTYELLASGVIRFEYAFVEKESGSLVPYPSSWANTAAVSFAEVSGIVCTIAVIEPRSRALISASQVSQIVDELEDFSPGMGPTGLIGEWRNSAQSATMQAIAPQRALSGLRFYQRHFPL